MENRLFSRAVVGRKGDGLVSRSQCFVEPVPLGIPHVLSMYPSCPLFNGVDG